MTPHKPSIKIAFLGDISLNDAYVALYRKGEKPFTAVESILSQCDHVVGNLECMAKGDQGENRKGFINQVKRLKKADVVRFVKKRQSS